MHQLDEGLREVNKLEDSLDDYDKKLEVRRWWVVGLIPTLRYILSIFCRDVCLTGCSVRRNIWVLMGPDLNKCSSQAKKAIKLAGQVVHGNIKREKQI